MLWFSSGYHRYQFSAAEQSPDVPVQDQILIFFIAGHKLLCCFCSIHVNQNKKEK